MIDEVLNTSANSLQSAAFVSDKARQLAAASQYPTAAPFFAELLAAELDGDAMWMLPYTMSVRQGVWWNCLCAWHAFGAQPGPVEDGALRAMLNWLRAPSSESAAQAIAAVASDDMRTSLGCCGHAIRSVVSSSDRRMLSGTAKLLGHGAQLSLQAAKRGGVSASARQFVLFGLDVAAGKACWN